MRTALVASKWFDVCNGLECASYFRLEKPTVILIGRGQRQQEVTEYCRANGLSVIKLLDPDIYSWFLAPRLKRGLFKVLFFPLNFALALIYWRLIVLLNYFSLRSESFSIVITDLWRTKCSVLPDLRPKHLYVIDGGYSTLALGLLDSWSNSNPGNSVRSYLKQQAVHSVTRRGGSSRFVTIIRHLYSNSFYGSPLFVRERAVKAINNLKISPVLFSSYIKTDPACGIVQNSYAFSRAAMTDKPIGRCILIIGHPEFKTLKSSIAVIESLDLEDSQEILYMFHPRDRELMKRDDAVSSLYESRVGALGFQVCRSSYSLEHFLLREERLPSSIISYTSSSVSWLKKVLPAAVSLYEVGIGSSAPAFNDL